jgi:hypothetical protein
VPEGDHLARVDAWLKAVGADAPPERLVGDFAAAFDALWKRAKLTLGDVTLAAIVDRVLYTAVERLPAFSTVRLTPNGEIDVHGLRERLSSVPNSELRDGIRFVLVELLTVIGNLTAEILSPELHAELSRIVAEHGKASRS